MRFIIMIAFIGLMSTVAFGAVVIVQPEESIQAAVNVAAEHDTIVIHDGTYVENIVVWKNLTIGSLFLIDGDTTHIGQTVIRAGTQYPDTGSCFIYATSQARLGRLIGLSLTGGTGTITSDRQAHGGGGVYVWRSGITIEHCNFLRATAEFGGGLYVEGNIITHAREASVMVSNCHFDSCNAYQQGGGIWAGACSLNVASCVFTNSIAPGGAAGAIVVGSVANFDTCSFINGVSGDTGGLIYLSNLNGRIMGCLFDQTSTYATSCLATDRSTAPITGCTFRGVNGAKVAYIQGSGTPLTFTHNLVVSNASSAMSTGTIIISNGPAEVSHNQFIDNWNNNGGALTVQGYVVANIHDNVFINNTEQNLQYGSAIMAWDLTAADVYNNVFDGNNGNCIYFNSNRLDSMDARTNYWGDHSGPYELLSNPSGLGDTLRVDTTRGRRVIYYPYLGAPPDTITSAPPRRLGSDRRWQLDDVYPNPFNAITTIPFTIKQDSRVTLTAYNQLGQQMVTLVDRIMVAGTYQELWDARGQASGVYFIRLEAGGATIVRRAVLLK